VSNDFCCPRTGEAGQGQHLKNFPRLAPKQAAKRKGVLGVRVPREFLPACCPMKQDCGFLPAACGGGQSKVGVGIFAEIRSDFI